MDRQTLRDWVHRFNACGPDGLKDAWYGGPPSRLSPGQKAELARIVETGPDPVTDGVVRWRRIDLKRVIEQRFGVAYHERHFGRLLKELGFSHMSARPRHRRRIARSSMRIKKFPRTLSAHLTDLPPGKPVEIWFQDEARIGQKNGLVRQWARRGTRPRQPADQRYSEAARAIGSSAQAERPICSALSVRRYLSGTRHRRGLGAALCRHPSHAHAP